MLELLTCALFITVGDRAVVDLHNIWEAIDDEGPEKHRIRDFIFLNGQTHQTGQRLELGDLNKAIDVVVLEEQRLKLQKAL